MTLALLASLALAPQDTTEDARRIQAVKDVVALARHVQDVCQPRYRTDPPTPINRIPDLPFVARWAEPSRQGGYYVNYGGLFGAVQSNSVVVTFDRSVGLPERAREWTQEERFESARRIAEAIIPVEFELGESYRGEPDALHGNILTDIVLRADPRLRVHRIDISIDHRTGLPHQVRKLLQYPEVSLNRIRGILPETALAAESLRIHRLLPNLPSARLARCQLVYQVPDFRQVTHEMTPAHHEHVARKEAIPLYQWLAIHRSRGYERMRVVWTDARTGRAVATQDYEFHYAGATESAKPIPRPDAGRWTLGKAEGTFAKAEPATFEGVPTVVAGAAGEVLTLRFDAASGLARDESGTYRPDAALLRAMRAEPPPRPFGKPPAAR